MRPKIVEFPALEFSKRATIVVEWKHTFTQHAHIQTHTEITHIHTHIHVQQLHICTHTHEYMNIYTHTSYFVIKKFLLMKS